MEVQRLNMDNSWFFHLGRLRFLVDPWLEGEEVDYFRWFNTQWHRTPPLPYDQIPDYDLVLITQKYPDHFHQQTLARLNPARVIVPVSIEKKVKTLLPKAEVIAMGARQRVFETQGVRFTWYPSTRPLGPVFDACCVSDATEALFLAPHGYQPNKRWLAPDQPVKLLITTFNELKLPFFLGGRIAPGIRGLMSLGARLHPAYLVATHDEDKHAKGLVMKLAAVQSTTKADLETYPSLQNRILEIDHYRCVKL
ncbi:MAG: MBL fold metallo-hydrolase [Lewinellaceae bacterium]|nr:MBL fold metallo-hydrolase [Lewinellaceae bacterium]